MKKVGASDLNAPLFAKGCPCRSDGGAVTGRAEHTRGSWAAERGFRDPFEGRCGRRGESGEEVKTMNLLSSEVKHEVSSLVVSIFLTSPLPLA